MAVTVYPNVKLECVRRASMWCGGSCRRHSRQKGTAAVVFEFPAGEGA
ncbi:hypothetical protein TcasGA2_TC031987 [Tribolium castaneum]|uniref:Uncharacterized protein n=1 Tax=Tribolium castaneum TaxID=7070 RepID=A0A139WNK5_TRICA|nr:hypothetical protein TcasGA2_TC031987 [Tribolium castaneum]